MNYRKIPIISPTWAYICSKGFFAGLIFRGNLFSAVDKTRNMKHSGTFRNIPEHEKKNQFLFRNLKIK